MEKNSDGGPAFPSGLVEMEDDSVESLHKGMTLRDYFAAKILPWVCHDLSACEGFYKRAAEKSYQVADAMLEARK